MYNEGRCIAFVSTHKYDTKPSEGLYMYLFHLHLTANLLKFTRRYRFSKNGDVLIIERFHTQNSRLQVIACNYCIEMLIQNNFCYNRKTALWSYIFCSIFVVYIVRQWFCSFIYILILHWNLVQ